MVQTRSMTKAIQSSMVINSITTPGIITQIVSKLDFKDKGLSSIYLMINNKELRYELQPFIDNIANHNYEKHLKNIKELQRKEIISKIRKYLNNITLSEQTSKKVSIILTMFDYLNIHKSNLYLLGKTFGKAIDTKIDHFIIDGTRKQLPELISKMHESRMILNDYINWSYTI